MGKDKDQHVVPHDGGWAVQGAGNSKATKVRIPVNPTADSEAKPTAVPL